MEFYRTIYYQWYSFLNILYSSYVLFFQQVQDTYRDLINILIGTYVAVLTKPTDYWFKEKDDPEHKESTDLHTKPSE